MIVEIIGPPGAGKSTFADELRDSKFLKFMNLGGRRDTSGETLSILRRRLQWSWATFTRPALARELARLRTRTPDVDRQLLEVLRRDMLVRRLRGLGEPLLIDDGSWHAAMWCAALGGQSQLSASIATGLYRPDLFVYVTEDPQVCWRRVADEGGRESFDCRGRYEICAAIERYNRIALHLQGHVIIMEQSMDTAAMVIDEISRG